MRDFHGLLASLTQLYHAVGRHIVINIRVPDTAHLRADDVRYNSFLQFISKTAPKHAMWKTETGFHSGYRTVCDDRDEKLKSRLPLGDERTAADVATLTASWIISGRSATKMKSDIQRALHSEATETVRDCVKDGTVPAPDITIPVRSGNSLHAIRGILEEYASRKGYKLPDSPLVRYTKANTDMDRLLRLVIRALGTDGRPGTVSPYTVAETLFRVAKRTKGDLSLTIADLEAGMARLSPNQLLPVLPSSTTAAVQTLLHAEQPLRKSKLTDAAGISDSSWQRCLGTDGPETDIRAMGIITTTQTGRHPAYTATLEPWWTPDAPASKCSSRDTASPTSQRDVLWELAHALNLAIDESVFTGIANINKIYRTHPELKQWAWLIDASFLSGDVLDTEPPPQPLAVFGPDALEQSQLSQRFHHSQRQQSPTVSFTG